MNAYELAETRVMLDRIGMSKWAIRYRRHHEEQGLLVREDSMGMVTDYLVNHSFFLIMPDTGYVIDIYRRVNARTGTPYMWHVCWGDITRKESWTWQRAHTELESALADLYIQIWKAGIA